MRSGFDACGLPAGRERGWWRTKGGCGGHTLDHGHPRTVQHASGNSIVVNTGKVTETLTLASDSSIRMGAARLSPADLTAHAGHQVKVRYSEANGQRMVQTMQIEGGTSPSARAQAPVKK